MCSPWIHLFRSKLNLIFTKSTCFHLPLLFLVDYDKTTLTWSNFSRDLQRAEAGRKSGSFGVETARYPRFTPPQNAKRGLSPSRKDEIWVLMINQQMAAGQGGVKVWSTGAGNRSVQSSLTLTHNLSGKNNVTNLTLPIFWEIVVRARDERAKTKARLSGSFSSINARGRGG